jgi:hypothetical protein
MPCTGPGFLESAAWVEENSLIRRCRVAKSAWHCAESRPCSALLLLWMEGGAQAMATRYLRPGC